MWKYYPSPIAATLIKISLGGTTVHVSILNKFQHDLKIQASSLTKKLKHIGKNKITYWSNIKFIIQKKSHFEFLFELIIN
jgi:hypothetical protein